MCYNCHRCLGCCVIEERVICQLGGRQIIRKEIKSNPVVAAMFKMLCDKERELMCCGGCRG